MAMSLLHEPPACAQLRDLSARIGITPSAIFATCHKIFCRTIHCSSSESLAYPPTRLSTSTDSSHETNTGHAMSTVSTGSSHPRGFSGLPPEVMSQIFLLACDPETLSPHGDIDRPQLRLTLQLVCEDWRRIVVTTGRLWNQLDLRISSNSDQNPHDNMHMVSLAVADSVLRRANSWLCLAGSIPVSLDLLVAPCTKAETAELRGRIFSFLSAYKFGALSIVTFVPSILDLNEYAASLHDVEALSLTTSLPFPCLIQPLLPLPSLTRLTLDVDLDHSYTNLLSAFPWHHLRELMLGVTGHPELAAGILRQCKSLVHCTVSISGEQDSTSFTARLENIDLPCLLHLTIDNRIIGPVTNAIVRSIIASKLESLVIFCKQHRGSASISDALEEMARRSCFQDSLRKLTLRNLHGVANLGKILKLMPSLCGFQLCRTTVNKILGSLSDGSLGPRLEKICFSKCGVGPDALLEMVEKRQIIANTPSCTNVTSFTHVVLRIRGFPVTREHHKRVTRLQDEYGLEILLLHDDSFSGVDEDGDDRDEADVVSEDDSGSMDE